MGRSVYGYLRQGEVNALALLLSDALLAGGIAFAMIASGAAASSRMEQLVDAEAAA